MNATPTPSLAEELSDTGHQLDTGLDVLRLAHAYLRDNLEGHEHSMLFGALDVALDRLTEAQARFDALATRASREAQEAAEEGQS